jgi:hypothetical protein
MGSAERRAVPGTKLKAVEPAAHAGRGSRTRHQRRDGDQRADAEGHPGDAKKIARSKSLFIAPPIGVRVQNYATSTFIPGDQTA